MFIHLLIGLGVACSLSLNQQPPARAPAPIPPPPVDGPGDVRAGSWTNVGPKSIIGAGVDTTVTLRWLGKTSGLV